VNFELLREIANLSWSHCIGFVYSVRQKPICSCLVYQQKYFCRYLQRFWGASGDYWQSNWEYIYDLFAGDEMYLAIWGMFYW